MPIPLLLLSDAPTAGTGLGRITRDLATRIHANMPDVFRVATLGYGGQYSSKLGFHQYEMDMQDWVVFNLPDVWKDFAQGERGILLSIWDASRLLWLSRPENCADPRLRAFLQSKPFDLWTYTPMDATGPNNKLTAILKHTLEGFDRVLAYSQWAEDILRRTLTNRPILIGLTNLPHGIDTSVFQPRNRSTARHGFGERIGAKTAKGKFVNIPDDALAIGIVGTNQPRKDWGLGIATVAELAKSRNVFLWTHIDRLENAWSIPALVNDFGLLEQTIITGIPLTDEQMSWCYSAMDCTLGIGTGEGYGFGIFESLACGTPCVHGNYGGAPEHMPSEMVVHVAGEVSKLFRIEGPYNCLRPIYDVDDWVQNIDFIIDNEIEARLPEHLDWTNLWPHWEQWLREGVK